MKRQTQLSNRWDLLRQSALALIFTPPMGQPSLARLAVEPLTGLKTGDYKEQTGFPRASRSIGTFSDHLVCGSKGRV